MVHVQGLERKHSRDCGLEFKAAQLFSLKSADCIDHFPLHCLEFYTYTGLHLETLHRGAKVENLTTFRGGGGGRLPCYS